MADYHLTCYDCSYETEETDYIVTCPHCRGFVEVTLDNLPSDRVVDHTLQSIFRFQDFMPYTYESGYEALEFMDPTPEFVDDAMSDCLDVQLIIKDETVMPTETWKDREGFVSLHRLKINGISDLMVFSSGNTGTSLARSACLFKGPKLHFIVPEASRARIEKLHDFYDSRFVDVQYFNGSNDECIIEAKRVAEGKNYRLEGGFGNYARREGLKLLALEHLHLSERQIDWYVQPVAGGIGVYSFDKACQDSGRPTPRMLGVQAEICDPMVRAWKQGAEVLERRFIPKNVVPSEFVRVLRTRDPGDAYRILRRILVRCDGAFESVNDEQILAGLQLFYQSDYFRDRFHKDGQLIGLEPATAIAGLAKCIDEGVVAKGSRVLLNVSGAAKEGDVKLDWLRDNL